MPYASGCRDCGGALRPNDGTRCEACRATRNAQAAKERQARRECGLCLVCSAPVARKRLGKGRARYCAAHLDYYAARQREE